MTSNLSTSKHTPGPWNNPEVNQVDYMGDTYNTEVIYQRDSADLVPIAFVALNDPEQSVANGRLIAAAPELLEALCAALPIVEDACEFMKDDFKPGVLNRLKAQIRAAIAKAEGN